MTLARADDASAVLPDQPAADSAAGRSIHFPAGLPGFPDVRQFVLERAGEARILLLRGLDDPQPCFIVLPLGATSAPLHDWLAGAAASLGIAGDDLAVLAVATRRDGTVLRANARAPLLVDTRRRLGWQVVLPAMPAASAPVAAAA
jgi:hypothetical protein